MGIAVGKAEYECMSGRSERTTLGILPFDLERERGLRLRLFKANSYRTAVAQKKDNFERT